MLTGLLLSWVLAGTAMAPAGVDEARATYLEGKAAFEVGEYQQALDLWKRAFRSIDDTPQFEAIRHTLVYNISSAHLQLYEIAHDVTHLRKAKTLLEQYLNNHEVLYGDDPDAVDDREDATNRLADIEHRLAEAEARESAPAPVTDPAASAEGPTPETPMDPHSASRLARMQQIQADPKLRRQNKRYRSMVIAGSVLIPTGALFGLTGFFGRTDTSVPGPPGPANYVVGGLGTAAVLGGIPLLLIGAVKGKRLRTPTAAESTTRFQLGPAPGGVSLAIRI